MRNNNDTTQSEKHARSLGSAAKRSLSARSAARCGVRARNSAVHKRPVVISYSEQGPRAGNISISVVHFGAARVLVERTKRDSEFE